ncbi:MAG TPA: ATP-binding cassette domain-containing protein [Chthonomonadales bacterium]|nr:ATP-binding cassette domain-containing protein [Chthonomonadales bacterium]
MDTVLDMRDVGVRRGGRTVLHGVTLLVRAGEWVSIFGPNGSGKSLVLTAAAGRVPLSEGSVHRPRCAGRQQRPPGLVSDARLPHLPISVRRLLAWSASLGGGTPAARSAAVAEAATVMNLHRVRSLPVGRLSAGQRAAVAIGAALCRRPPILLLDDLLRTLDAPTRQRLVAHLEQRCADDGMAVLHATVDAEDAARADRVLMLDEGRQAALAPPAQLLASCAADRVVLEAADPRSTLPTLTGVFDVEVTEERGEIAFRAADGMETAAHILRRPTGGVRVVRVRPPNLWDAWEALRARTAP